jgi:hypothetical protein
MDDYGTMQRLKLIESMRHKPERDFGPLIGMLIIILTAGGWLWLAFWVLFGLWR